ncbi:MAG TPA: hypothetical protein DD420_30095, partial [Streptomyces sp.]|nr:hypothetical protein [Streptomyces sp.]
SSGCRPAIRDPPFNQIHHKKRLLKGCCIPAARIDQCERELLEHGLLVRGEREWQKNGATTIAGQYRSQLARYIRELRLSPSARTPTSAPAPDANDSDVWD